MTKRELANRIIALGYRANKTGEIPSESSIYAYLNGSIELKADLLPYIAEALNIYEQELFSSESKSKKILQNLYRNDIEKYAEIIDLLEYVSPKTIETLKSILQKAKADNQSLNAMLKGYLKMGGGITKIVAKIIYLTNRPLLKPRFNSKYKRITNFCVIFAIMRGNFKKRI